jgi:hypothetical protein
MSLAASQTRSHITTFLIRLSLLLGEKHSQGYNMHLSYLFTSLAIPTVASGVGFTNNFEVDEEAMLLITHDVEEAVTLADRVVLLEAGRVELDIPVPLSRPRHRGDAKYLNKIICIFF